MSRKSYFSFLLIVICVACESNGDGCEEGYIRQYGAEGTSWCVEEFVEGISTDFQTGDIYYHKKHGVITYADGVWINKFDQVVKP